VKIKRNSARKEMENALSNMLKTGALKQRKPKLLSKDLSPKDLRNNSELQMILLALRKMKHGKSS
tara:strand:- start:267 stop:461 length:195 start_codon:yes stop_codon:yes gene_type:complete